MEIVLLLCRGGSFFILRLEFLLFFEYIVHVIFTLSEPVCWEKWKSVLVVDGILNK